MGFILTRTLRHTVSSRLVAVSVSALMIVPAARAAGNLEAALRTVPDSALATSDPMPIVFLDVRALSEAAGGALSDAALRRMAFHESIRPLNVLSYGGARTWTETAGIPFDDISYFAAFGQPPARVSYWGLATKAAADNLIGKLQDRTFRPVTTAPRILANGEPRAVSLRNRQPTNPWSGPMGEISAVLAIDRVVAQASAAADLENLTGVGRSAADHGAVATALAGMATADDRDPGAIVQAAVVTPLMGTPPAILPPSYRPRPRWPPRRRRSTTGANKIRTASRPMPAVSWPTTRARRARRSSCPLPIPIAGRPAGPSRR